MQTLQIWGQHSFPPCEPHVSSSPPTTPEWPLSAESAAGVEVSHHMAVKHGHLGSLGLPSDFPQPESISLRFLCTFSSKSSTPTSVHCAAQANPSLWFSVRVSGDQGGRGLCRSEPWEPVTKGQVPAQSFIAQESFSLSEIQFIHL